MKLPRELTTETMLSKILSVVVVLALPFIAFLYGAKYQKFINTVEYFENHSTSLTSTDSLLN